MRVLLKTLAALGTSVGVSAMCMLLSLPILLTAMSRLKCNGILADCQNFGTAIVLPLIVFLLIPLIVFPLGAKRLNRELVEADQQPASNQIDVPPGAPPLKARPQSSQIGDGKRAALLISFAFLPVLLPMLIFIGIDLFHSIHHAWFARIVEAAPISAAIHSAQLSGARPDLGGGKTPELIVVTMDIANIPDEVRSYEMSLHFRPGLGRFAEGYGYQEDGMLLYVRRSGDGWLYEAGVPLKPLAHDGGTITVAMPFDAGDLPPDGQPITIIPRLRLYPFTHFGFENPVMIDLPAQTVVLSR